MSNPILNQNFAEQERVLQGEPMTVNGTLQIAFFLGLIVFATAAYVWSRFSLGYMDQVQVLTTIGAIAGFVLALIISFTRTKALIPVYAAAEGLMLGGISAIAEAAFSGIVLQAVAGTFAAFFSMLLLYRTGIIRATEKFRGVVFTSTLAVLGVYLINFIGSFFGYTVPGLMANTNIGIAISLVIIVIAALNLILDFDFIEKGAQNFLPKDYEWFGAFGLLVTLVWLYMEILRLLMKFQSRD